MKQTNRGYVLSSGKEIIGVSFEPTADYCQVWDDHHGRWTHKTNFTQEEKKEIADYAISLWKEWAKND